MDRVAHKLTETGEPHDAELLLPDLPRLRVKGERSVLDSMPELRVCHTHTGNTDRGACDLL